MERIKAAKMLALIEVDRLHNLGESSKPEGAFHLWCYPPAQTAHLLLPLAGEAGTYEPLKTRCRQTRPLQSQRGLVQMEICCCGHCN